MECKPTFSVVLPLISQPGFYPPDPIHPCIHPPIHSCDKHLLSARHRAGPGDPIKSLPSWCSCGPSVSGELDEGNILLPPLLPSAPRQIRSHLTGVLFNIGLDPAPMAPTLCAGEALGHLLVPLGEANDASLLLLLLCQAFPRAMVVLLAIPSWNVHTCGTVLSPGGPLGATLGKPFGT